MEMCRAILDAEAQQRALHGDDDLLGYEGYEKEISEDASVRAARATS